jgi:hypothetical protein
MSVNEDNWDEIVTESSRDSFFLYGKMNENHQLGTGSLYFTE